MTPSHIHIPYHEFAGVIHGGSTQSIRCEGETVDFAQSPVIACQDVAAVIPHEHVPRLVASNEDGVRRAAGNRCHFAAVLAGTENFFAAGRVPQRKSGTFSDREQIACGSESERIDHVRWLNAHSRLAWQVPVSDVPHSEGDVLATE